MCIHFDFDFKKATQALNYIAQKFNGRINKMKAIKLIYFADRYHLRNFGRPVTNDEYVAMQYGPVGSKTKDIAEFTDFLDKDERDYCSKFIKRQGLLLDSIDDVEHEVFSDSDIEALDFAIERLGMFDQFQLAQISHAYPEWKKHEREIIALGRSSIRMDYEDFFNDPVADDPNMQMLRHRDIYAMSQEDKESIKEYLQEQQELKQLWERRSA